MIKYTNFPSGGGWGIFQPTHYPEDSRYTIARIQASRYAISTDFQVEKRIAFEDQIPNALGLEAFRQRIHFSLSELKFLLPCSNRRQQKSPFSMTRLHYEESQPRSIHKKFLCLEIQTSVLRFEIESQGDIA